MGPGNRQVHAAVKGLKSSAGRVVFSPDGGFLATASSLKLVSVWAVATGEQLATLTGPDRMSVVAFSPDGKSLAGGSEILGRTNDATAASLNGGEQLTAITTNPFLPPHEPAGLKPTWTLPSRCCTLRPSS